MDWPFGNLKRNHYRVLLVDPPWAFRSYGGADMTPHRTQADHYSVLSHADLCALPVGYLAAKDCALFMWVVDSHLNEALALASSWGFSFKTRAFTWRKLTKNGLPKIGMGYWTRKQTEMCWLFTKGKPSRVGKGVRELLEAECPTFVERMSDEEILDLGLRRLEIIDAQRREHSRKPDEQYERIEALVEGPYAELFARQSRPGWSSWGLEVGKFDRVDKDILDFLAA